MHWIVWNEVDSSAWFDMSPQVNGKFLTCPYTQCIPGTEPLQVGLGVRSTIEASVKGWAG